MDEEQNIPAPRPRLVGPAEAFAVAGASLVVGGVALIHVPTALILAGIILVLVAGVVALARV